MKNGILGGGRWQGASVTKYAGTQVRVLSTLRTKPATKNVREARRASAFHAGLCCELPFCGLSAVSTEL